MEWEKDRFQFAKERLAALIRHAELDDAGTTRLTDLLECDGEVLMVSSNGKVRAVYDLCVAIKWEAGTKGEAPKAVGIVRIPELSPSTIQDGLEISIELHDVTVVDPAVRAQMQDLVLRCAQRSMIRIAQHFVDDLHRNLGTEHIREDGLGSGKRASTEQEVEDEFTDEMLEAMLKGMDLTWNSDDDEELDSIPLFMDELPQGSDNDAAEALKAILAEQTSTASELKDQGNLALQKGGNHYKVAILRYTEALGCKEPDAILNSAIFSNRAHVHMLNRNWGRALSDCKDAIANDRKNVKAHFRAAKCCNALHKYQHAVRFAGKGLTLDMHNAALARVLKKAKAGFSRELESKQAQKARQITDRTDEQSAATASRELRVGDFRLDSQTSEYGDASRHLIDQQLCWPVLFVYEEPRQRDFIKSFAEMATLGEQLSQMFPPMQPPAPWDMLGAYRMGNIGVYFIAEWAGQMRHSTDGAKWHSSWDDGAASLGKRYVGPLDLSTPLKTLLLHPQIEVPGWPIFHVFVEGSPFLAEAARAGKLSRA
jgi:hypothetical protein